jgi:hypothetical protein
VGLSVRLRLQDGGVRVEQMSHSVQHIVRHRSKTSVLFWRKTHIYDPLDCKSSGYGMTVPIPTDPTLNSD